MQLRWQGLHQRDGIVHRHRVENGGYLLGAQLFEKRLLLWRFQLGEYRSGAFRVVGDEDLEDGDLLGWGQPPKLKGDILGTGLPKELRQIGAGTATNKSAERVTDQLGPPRSHVLVHKTPDRSTPKGAEEPAGRAIPAGFCRLCDLDYRSCGKGHCTGFRFLLTFEVGS